MKSHFLDHGFIFIQNAALKDPEAFLHVAAESQVHPGLVELDGIASAQDPADGHFERHSKIERQIGTNGKTIQIAHPTPADAAHDVAREGGVCVTVRAHHCARLHQRNDVTLQAVGEIGGVDQAERHRREHVLLLAAAGGFTHQRRRVPFAEGDGDTLRTQPLA